MRKLLLGTSALIGATALVASATAAAPELTVSGKLNFQWTGGENPILDEASGIGDGEDVGNAQSGWKFDQINSQSEINFFAEGESDGGTTYGANIDYRFLARQTDEAYIFVSGDWGTLHLGQDDGAVNQTRFYAGSIAPGGYLIDGTTTYAGYAIGDDSDNQKILYVSNDLSGFKFALSVSDSTGYYEDRYEVGASYTADVGDGFIGISLGYFTAAAGDEGDAGTAAAARATAQAAIATAASITGASTTEIEDLSEYVIGIKAGFGPFSVAGSYSDAGDSGVAKNLDADRSQYTAGVAYDLGGGMAVGVSYSEITKEVGTLENTYELTTVDFGFPIMTGMNGYAGIAFSETEQEFADGNVGSAAAVDLDATTYVIGTKVSF